MSKKAEKTNGKTPAPAQQTEEVTIRKRVFELLAKNPSTGSEIQKALGLSGVPSLLKDEAVCEKPRIKRERQEGQRGIVYSLTALGRADLAKGKVDDNAAAKSSGQGLLKDM